MILRFGIENHRSFKDYVELSFVSTSRQDEPSWRIATPNAPYGVLPAVGLWGANASGKSNILHALRALRDHIAYSFSALRPDQPVPWNPWQMQKEQDAPLTRMDIDFLVDGIRHHFGFKLRDTGYVEEWLYRWPEGRKQLLYHRNHLEASPWYLGAALKGRRQQIVEATRPNSLFLSAAAQHNHVLLGAVYRALVSGITDGSPVELNGFPLFFSDSPILDPALRPTLLKFLASADIGVVDFREIELPSATEDLKRQLSTSMAEGSSDLLGHLEKRGTPRRLSLVHGAPGEKSWELDPRLESRGTWVLLSHLHDLFALLRRGGLLVLDEIDTSLHPDLCGALIDLFTSSHSNPKGAQLLFSTHDRNLLSRLRTDEVVLVDKGHDGVSSLHAASDFKDIRVREDLRKAHEQGRLRGVPVLGDLAGVVIEGLHNGT